MRVALVQLTSSDDPPANLLATSELIRKAAAGGARFVLTPEVTNCVSASRTRQIEVLRSEVQDDTLAGLSDLARENGIWLLIGSLALRQHDGGGRFVNRSFLVAPDGEIRARYDKIHMFDVSVSSTETYRESSGYRPGDRAVLTHVDDIPVGLTICYDIRFPHLYRRLAIAGTRILTVPSAFSQVTGAAHWESLLRARAIECGAFVLAPAQTGRHAAMRGRARKTYGHSMAIGPWGEILADAGTAPGVTFVDLDMKAVEDCRRRVPSLLHDRPFKGP